MSLRFLIDMNLSPDWESWFQVKGIDAIHWSRIGDPRATDAEILDWARVNDYVIFTHDLDFGTILAMTHFRGPSVLQLRGQNVLPDHAGRLVISAIVQFESPLAQGALVTVDAASARAKMLPIKP
jgi:predicted nuclease of predicted toxin-antitoxin system